MKKIFFLLILLSSSFCFSQWSQVGEDINGATFTNLFGTSVAINNNGNIIVVGAPLNDDNGNHSGQVKVFKEEANLWQQLGNDINGDLSGDQLGSIVSINNDGNIIAVGIPHASETSTSNRGKVEVYKYKDNEWIQLGTDIIGLSLSDNYGSNLDLNGKGDLLVVSGKDLANEGHVETYKFINNSWIKLGGSLLGEARTDHFGTSISLNDSGNILAVGATHNNGDNQSLIGNARIYRNNGTDWIQIGEDIDGNEDSDRLGYSIDLNNEGTIVAVGITKNNEKDVISGQVKIFKNVGEQWVQLGQSINGDNYGDELGSALCLNNEGNVIAVGSLEKSGNVTKAGYVKIFKYTNNEWAQLDQKINGTNNGDQFGTSISLNGKGTRVVLGAPYNRANNKVSAGQAIVLENQHSILSSNRVKIEKFIIKVDNNKITINLSNIKIKVFNLLSQQVPNEELKGLYIVKLEDNLGNIQTNKILIP